MKKLLFLFVITIAFLSCKKDKSDSAANTFSIGGSIYDFTKMTSREITDPAAVITVISSADNNGYSMRVSVNNKATGSYTLSNICDVYLVVGIDEYISVNGTGSISITRFDDTVIQGTFSGTFESLTDGSETTASGSFTVTK
jgi:hypothetical protein